jgi:hypothetical protein
MMGNILNTGFRSHHGAKYYQSTNDNAKEKEELFTEYILGCIERALSFANMIPLEAPLIYANCDTNGVKGFSTNDHSEE